MKPYLTKIGYGRNWWYRDTSRRYKIQRKILGRWLIVISYRKVYEHQGRFYMVAR